MSEEIKDYNHWRNLTDTEHFRAEMLAPGQEMVLTIKNVVKEKITATNGQIAEKPVLHFVEDVKPMIANVTNCKIIEKLFGTGNIYEWEGKKIQIFATSTRVGGSTTVPCLRVRNYLPKGNVAEYRCSVCGKIITKQIYDGSIAKYGKAYCSKDCVDREKNGKKVDL